MSRYPPLYYTFVTYMLQRMFTRILIPILCFCQLSFAGSVTPMLKYRQDHQIKTSPFCGEIHEILTNKDKPGIDIAMVFDIKPTTAHFHRNFEEIYFVMDGTVTVEFYDPAAGKISQAELGANELIVFTPGVHHRVVSASEKNRLCVISLPGFDPHDEHLSDKI